MPNLVSGHMRFTEEDFLLSDYAEKIKEDQVAVKKSKDELCTSLITQLRIFLHTIKANDASVIEQKAFLSEGLFKLTSLAHILGFTLEDLIKEKI
jgi:hypothetical protein